MQIDRKYVRILVRYTKYSDNNNLLLYVELDSCIKYKLYRTSLLIKGLRWFEKKLFVI